MEKNVVLFQVHRTYISKYMIVLMACFPTVGDWITSPSLPPLCNTDPLSCNCTASRWGLSTYTLLYWCAVGIRLVHWLLWLIGFSRRNMSTGFKCAWVVWLAFSHSCHPPWEEHIQDAASTMGGRDVEQSQPTDMHSHEQEKEISVIISPWNFEEKND